MCANFQAKWTTHFFGPNLPKNVFWGWNFKNLSVNLESAPPKYHVCQFSGKTDNFEFFDLKISGYFASNNVEGVAKNSVKAEMNWVEACPRFSNTLKFITHQELLYDKNYCSGGNL